MAQFLEFLGNHWILTSLWLFFLVALIVYSRAKSGKALGVHATTQLINRSNALVLDVRPKKDFDKGHITDAVHIPMDKLKDRFTELEKHKDAPIVVVCNLGNQSGEGVNLLTREGFTQVRRLQGGITEWSNQGLPLVTE